MKIAFIGAGNLATHLAIKLFDSGHQITQIYSRTVESAKKLAERVGASYSINISEIADQADLYIFSVKDSVLEALIREMPHHNGLWLHTAGSMSADMFKAEMDNFGVLYPLQTFSKEKPLNWNDIPIFIEANNEEVLLKIRTLAADLSDKIYNLPSEKRIYIHASAVFACNFVNHMYDQAKRLTDSIDVPFDVLLPLIKETCDKIYSIPPHEAQTGPAVRFDTNVMQKHLDLLTDEDASELYKLISRSIYNSFK